jgi:hypothetical protein
MKRCYVCNRETNYRCTNCEAPTCKTMCEDLPVQTLDEWVENNCENLSNNIKVTLENATEQGMHRMIMIFVRQHIEGLNK